MEEWGPAPPTCGAAGRDPEPDRGRHGGRQTFEVSAFGFDQPTLSAGDGLRVVRPLAVSGALAPSLFETVAGDQRCRAPYATRSVRIWLFEQWSCVWPSVNPLWTGGDEVAHAVPGAASHALDQETISGLHSTAYRTTNHSDDRDPHAVR